MTGIFKINNNEVFGSDGTFSGTIGNATFPAGHTITSSYYELDGNHSGGSTSYQYSSSGSVVTCTNITITINKKVSSSKILMHWSVPFQIYHGNIHMSIGHAYWSRTAPSASDFGKTKLYFASESNSASGTSHAMNLYYNANNQFVDTSSATGNHTYVFKIDRDGTTSSGAFGTRPDNDNRGFLLATEVM